MTRPAVAILAMLVMLLSWSVVWAHESQPGTLELRQVARDRYEITWRAPIYYGRPHPARLLLPEDWTDAVEESVRSLPDSQVFRRVVIVGDSGVEGSVIRFPGLENTITDVFVRLYRFDGSTMTAVVRPSRPFAELRGERPWHVAAGEYTGLGFHHILRGVDHLLFILALLLIVQGTATLLKTITAFTIAHSITLAVATLGYASAPLPPLNAAIALSILFLGPEIVRARRGGTSLTIRYPWIVAFFFGLLHGFGFASGLSTTGMPAAELPWALLFFNVGVELGQVLFILIALALLKSLSRLDFRVPDWVRAVPTYAIGSAAAFWFFQRLSIMLV